MGLILASGSNKPKYPYDMWYGVEGDYTSRDNRLKRVGNLDLHRSLPVNNQLKRYVENTDGSVKYYLHQNDSRKKDSGAAAILDSTDGNVMLEKPEYYLHVEMEGTKWIYAISQYDLPGFIKMEKKAISPWYGTFDSETNTAVSGCWLTWSGNEIARDESGLVIFKDNAARYRGGSGSSDAGSDGTAKSMLGMARTSVSKATVRGYCKNGNHHGAFRAYNEIAWLMRIEYADLHCQAAYNPSLTPDGFHQGGLGNGTSVSGGEWSTFCGYKPFIPCGVTATLGNNTGVVPYLIKGWPNGDKTVQVQSYRGLEVPYEYLWLLADDVLIYHSPDTEEARSTAYLCEDPEKFTSHSDGATTVPDGYVSMADLPRASGNIQNLWISQKGYSFPRETGSNGVNDYFYHPGKDAKGWYGALLSAGAADGAIAGFGCLHTFGRSSIAYANFGFRLCRF